MKCTKVSSEEQSLTNRVVVNGADFLPSQVPHIKISTSPGVSYIMSTLEDNKIPSEAEIMAHEGRKVASPPAPMIIDAIEAPKDFSADKIKRLMAAKRS